ncbi:DinB family protein [Streptomyces sp. NPDC048718]|uniref:DinB family protein n=1 Tax=Streptomyces sp. NPDC048718 TaxID=3365587 RepID=UPI003719873A
MGGNGDWQRLVSGLFERVRRELAAALEGLADAELDERLAPGLNSPGWLAWHVARGQDRNVSELMGAPQLWVADGWAAPCGRPADPSDTGFGHSPAEAAAFRSPGGRLLLSYHRAVHERTERYCASAPAGDLGRSVTSPTLGNTHTVEERLRGLLADSFAHLGQIALLRGAPSGGAREEPGTR